MNSELLTIPTTKQKIETCQNSLKELEQKVEIIVKRQGGLNSFQDAARNLVEINLKSQILQHERDLKIEQLLEKFELLEENRKNN